MRHWLPVTAFALAMTSMAAAPPTLLHVSSHLPKAAKVSLDGGKPVRAPGYGSTVIPAAAGHHVLKVVTATGVTYQSALDLTTEQLFKWRGKGYWCVNLMERSFEVYSAENCNEDVADAG
ncbi:MAG TPA: hypothetical protein VMT68_12945 [Caulobacteraceae bacterium]|nr:hypothetical protein [Caulobacteraceae bacterium]